MTTHGLAVMEKALQGGRGVGAVAAEVLRWCGWVQAVGMEQVQWWVCRRCHPGLLPPAVHLCGVQEMEWGIAGQADAVDGDGRWVAAVAG